MRWLSYLRYRFRRKNAFQLHSPFVYRLYTEVIRAKGHGVRDASGALNTSVTQDASAWAALGIQNKVAVPLDQLLDRYLACRRQDTVFVAKDPHRDRNNEALWDTICRHPDVTLTIDLFHEGWVFYREGMEKQHYVLKA